MQTSQLTINLTVSIVGDDAGDAARVLTQAIDAGRLDLPFRKALREEMRAVDGDWRFGPVMARALVEEVNS